MADTQNPTQITPQPTKEDLLSPTSSYYQSNPLYLRPGETQSSYYSRLPQASQPQQSSNPAITTPTTPITNLPTGVDQSQVDTARTAQYATKTPEQASEDYRTSALKSAQDRINNINDIYAQQLKSELASQAGINENNLGRTNALSAMMGLAGSSSADTRASSTQQANEKINQGITTKVNTEKMNALNTIYNNIDSGAQKMYEAQLQTNKENQKKLLDDVAKNATSQIQALAGQLAGTGKTFDDFKNADSQALNNLMQQTGQSEYQLRQVWNNSLPEQFKPVIHTSYVDDGKGGTIMRQVSFDPITKKATSNDYNLAVPASTFNGDVKPIEGKNGELFVKQADGTYKDVSPNAENNLAMQKADLAYKQAQTAKTFADAAKVRNDLNGGNDVSTVGGQGVVGGQKVDPKIANDVEAVLEGRNTLYNIRQTMGRTNAAAAYMQKMRDTIAKIDPKFDFVASDAGGKFVSSTFYQKAYSAITSVEPNIDKAVELSDQVARIGVRGVDALLQKTAMQFGNTTVSNFHEAQKLIADEIGLALGQGTVSDMKLQLGFDVTDPNTSQEVFASNMKIVKEFIENRKTALNDQRYHSSVVDNNTTGTLKSPDGKSQVNISDLTPEQIKEAKTAGWQ